MGRRDEQRRRFLVPEVVQTSAMDCGPAALTAVLGGFGVTASYGRLREACHTDVDGTSIDTLEDNAVLLGLDAAQVMAPVDHVAIVEAGNLPAIVVTRLPNGFTHFVVAWRRVGRWVQVMDPAVGRRWVDADRFAGDVYVHRFEVPGDAWHAWARSDELGAPLRSMLARAGVDPAGADELIARASASDDWRELAALDAAARLAVEVARVRPVRDADALVRRLVESPTSIPDRCWFARPGTDGAVELRGAVLVRVAGPFPEPPPRSSLPPDVAAVLDDPPARPNREVLSNLWRDGSLRTAAFVSACVAAGVGTLAEAVVFREVLDDPAVGAPATLAALAVALLVLELAVSGLGFGLGRRTELRLRRALFTTLPRLPDAYLRSRPHSDMAERAHRVHLVRLLPELGAVVLRSTAQLVAIVIGLAALVPSRAPLALAAGAAAVAVPLAAVPAIAERDLRLRTHAGALARFFLDALLGLVPLRSHAAEATLRAEHGRLVEEWSGAGRSLFRFAVGADAVQSAIGLALAVAMVATLPDGDRSPGTVLLVAYWAVRIPLAGQLLTLALRQYPLVRNSARRLLEPLGAREDDGTATEPDAPGVTPFDIALRDLTVVAGGHRVLDEVTLAIGAGEHVAVVGHSGAGKSTLVGAVMGTARPARGTVHVGGAPPVGAHLARVRAGLAWLSPEVQLWNATVDENVRYGNPGASAAEVASAIRGADVDGLDHRHGPIGESGGLLSGGEGQRVRFARALLRRNARLVVLDEPFRGLDRDARATLLDRARRQWPSTTLLCVTHDVQDTVTFPRVVVVDGGRVVEDGEPEVLATDPTSRYRALLDAETAAADGFAGGPWVRWQLVDGRIG